MVGKAVLGMYTPPAGAKMRTSRAARLVVALALVLTAALVALVASLATTPERANAGAGAREVTAEDCVTEGGAGLPYAVGVNCRTIEVDGHPRKFIVYMPDRRPVTGPRVPVVFMFHGSSGDGEQFLRISGWREQADATGLVAVFPTGLRYHVLDSGRLSTKWNEFSLASQVDLDVRPPGYPDDAPWPANDVGFVMTMMGDMGGQFQIDRQRVYASGFSNGAGFAARLAVERSDVFAAAAFSAGALPAAQTPARPIPTWLTLGTLDDRVLARTDPPLAELPLDPLEILAQPPLADTIGAQVATAGLDTSDFSVVSDPHSTGFRWPPVGSGTDGGLFRFTMLDGLDHHYPNGHNNLADFDAAPEFWEFFRTHPRR